MNNLKLDNPYGKLYTPYSQKELAAHKPFHEIRLDLERTIKHNFELIELTDAWIAFLQCKAERPEKSITRFLRPGRNGENDACSRLERLHEFFGQYKSGACPEFESMIKVARSTMTLLEHLRQLFNASELDDAEANIKDFFAHVTYRGKPEMAQPKFAAELKANINGFTSACVFYSKKLADKLYADEQGIKSDSQNIIEIKKEVHEVKDVAIKIKDVSIDTNKKATETQRDVKEEKTIVKRIDERTKRRGRKDVRFSIETQDKAFSLWECAKNNPKVKESCRTNATYKAAFNWYKKDFEAVGVKSEKELREALKARTLRLTRH